VKPTDVALAIAVPLIWGFGFTAAKFALGDFPPIFLIACRFGLTALLLVWFVRIPRGKLVRIFFVALIGAALAYAFIYKGLKGIDVSTAAFLTQFEIPIALIIATIFLKERVGFQQLAGIVLSFVGIMFIFGEPKVQDTWWPACMVLLGGTAWAVGQVIARSVGNVGGFSLLAWLAVFATPLLFVTSLAVEAGHVQAIANASWESWAAVVYLAVVMNGMGYALWYHLLGKHPVNSVMPFQLLVPVASVLGGVVLLGERLTWMVALGGAIVILGVGIITVDWRALLKRRAA
jgi:O-acetylserine/cysteine efflux transporter